MRYYHEFSLELTGLPLENADNLIYGSGCDDVLVSIIDGKLYVDFCRESETYESAVAEATGQMKDLGAEIIEVHRINNDPVMVIEDNPPPHNSEAVLQWATDNIHRCVDVLVRAGRRLKERI